jgi:hypothetical protein
VFDYNLQILVLGIDCKKEGSERGRGAETKREKRGGEGGGQGVRQLL